MANIHYIHYPPYVKLLFSRWDPHEWLSLCQLDPGADLNHLFTRFQPICIQETESINYPGLIPDDAITAEGGVVVDDINDTINKFTDDGEWLWEGWWWVVKLVQMPDYRKCLGYVGQMTFSKTKQRWYLRFISHLIWTQQGPNIYWLFVQGNWTFRFERQLTEDHGCFMWSRRR